jgi:broad-specificity NMP kinase
MREKVINYKVTVTPPSKEALLAGRRRRAEACAKAVSEDLISAEERLNTAQDQRASLEIEMEELKKQLEQKQRSLKVVGTEEKWLIDRVSLRNEQKKLLEERLELGWKDENITDEM